MRLVAKGWPVPAAITLSEHGKWQAVIDGEPGPESADPITAGVDRIWHSGVQIPEHEYQYLLAVKAHALAHEPDHPAANPRKPITTALLRPIHPTMKGIR
jgi:hypothetical protein